MERRPVINTTVEELNGESREVIGDSTVRTLTDSALALSYDDLPTSTVHAAKRCLLDAIGCAIKASDSPLSNSLQRLAGTVTSSTPASVMGSPIKTSPEMAGFVNGSLIRCLDFNDDYFGTSTSNAKGDTGPHPSDNIGSVLAAAEMVGASGIEALLAIVTAYEVCGRLVDEVVLRSNGWDHPILHSISTAVAVGRLLRPGPSGPGQCNTPRGRAEHLSVRDPVRCHFQLEGHGRPQRKQERTLRRAARQR